MNTEPTLEQQLATAQQELKNVYRERAHLVAFLSALLPSTFAYTDPDTPDWPVLTIDLGEEGGQMSWHIAPEDTDLFPHLPPGTEGIAWDGHSTDEKYQRMRAFTADMAQFQDAGLRSLFQELASSADQVTEDQEERPEPIEPEPAPARKTTAAAKRTAAKKAGA